MLNAATPILFRPLPRLALVKPEHPENAESPMLVTVSGSVTLVIIELLNAPSPMLETGRPSIAFGTVTTVQQ
jgi:hypothetical protein